MKVLVCPLDWGLGHATRCIPLVRALIRNGHEVLIGAAGGGLNLLRGEFPELEVFEFPGYPIRYSRSAATLLPVLLAQLPGMLRGMIAERRALSRIVSERRVECVVSDGRYGVRSRRVPTVFVTHQLFIRPPGRFPGRFLAEALILALNRRLLAGFREVWVPDFPGTPNLSGTLSHRIAKGAKSAKSGRDRGPLGKTGLSGPTFIGPLSRFQPVERGWLERTPATSEDKVPAVDVLATVSGPEPQRGRFEAALRRALEGMDGTRVLIRGLPGSPAAADTGRQSGALALATGGLNVFDHLDGPAMEALFASAALVVARSGYTTVMEMASLGLRQVVLVATPGQPEQEYLADHLDAARIALGMDQDAIDLAQAQKRLGQYAGFAAFPRSAAPDGLPALSDFIREHPLFRTAPAG